MIIEDTNISGLKIIKSKILTDERGVFTKTFNSEIYKSFDLNLEIKETYYSVSKKNVIRGMHFQKPPYDHTKLVYVTYGSIMDVVLDVRKNSPTFGKTFSCSLSSDNGILVLIPKGLAHGFKSLYKNTVTTYMQTSCYKSTHDTGVRYDSFGFNWDCENPIISHRDKSLLKLSDLQTPF